MRPLPLVLVLAALAGCGTAPGYELQTAPATARLNTAAQSIMVREVSLPDYAADDTMARQNANGSVELLSRVRWADLQPRAITLALAKQLNGSLSATVAPEPWPLSGLPDGEVDVRIDRILAGADGMFHLDGVYYVRAEGVSLGATSRDFAISVPLSGTDGAQIAAAQSTAVSQLAAQIARSVAR
ncbi:membrane integrity-associated transporter subunit PqiC [Falsirhodobacter sp. alg1]|uniref:PqiC family protein n=1 Tax=Falsirhodobacter sp. alg1 TaxID=1472418 RepID=UPI0005EEDA24|nr:PqiC family protein [Falsirhodobacter sp. alg1]